MKKVFIAYFDLLGFKEFITLNQNDTLQKGMGHLFRDIEFSLSLGKQLPQKDGVIYADLSASKLNCLNISDTVIFWTNDCSSESFSELLEVAFNFNWREVCYFFPLRGTIVCGEIEDVKWAQATNAGGTYRISCIYGKGMVEAHVKADNQSWAGTVIDQSAIDEVSKSEDASARIERFAKKHLIPYKHPPENQQEEYALKLIETEMSEVGLEQRKQSIITAFSHYNKKTDTPRVKEILANTLSFLSSHKF